MPRYWITETAHYPDGREASNPEKWLDAPAAESVAALYRQRHGEQIAGEHLPGDELRVAFRIEGERAHVLEVLIQPDRTGNDNADPGMHAAREYIELRGLHLVEPTAAAVAGRLRELTAASHAGQHEEPADPIEAMRRSIELHAADGAGRAYLHAMLGDVLDHLRQREPIAPRPGMLPPLPATLNAPDLHPYRAEIKEATKDDKGNAIHPQVSVRATGPTREDAVADAGEMYRQALAEVGRVAPSRVGQNAKPAG